MREKIIEFICPQSKLLVEINQHSNYILFMSYSFEYIDNFISNDSWIYFFKAERILGKDVWESHLRIFKK